PQSDRAGLRQTQTPDASRADTGCRSYLAQGRRTPRSLLQKGMRQLFQKLRIWFRIKTSCSNENTSVVDINWDGYSLVAGQTIAQKSSVARDEKLFKMIVEACGF